MLNDKPLTQIVADIKTMVHDRRNQIKHCPICNANIADRQVTLYAGLIRTLYQIYKYLGEKKKHEFHIREVKHFLSSNDYARFGDLVRFGGIVYKPKNDDGDSHKGEFGMNMSRAQEFFRGERKIPVTITLNQITNEIIESNYVDINNFPELWYQLTADGEYNPKTAAEPQQNKLI